jgi:hypothetical protein
MDSYDESVHRRYSSSAVDRYPTVQWFYDSFEPNFESTIASSAAAATTTIDASQIMHSTTTAAAVNPNFSSPDIPAAATAAVTKNKRKKSQKRKKEHREVRTSTSAASKNKRLIKEVNRDSTVALRQKETAITSVATATAANDTTLTDFFNFENVKPAETANFATTTYTSSAGNFYSCVMYCNV